MKKCLAMCALAGVFAGSSAAATSTWTIDGNDSTAIFVVKHLGISNVQGNFTKVSGTVTLDEQDVSKSSVNATIDVASIDTRVAMRDRDLRSDHFFDVDKFPTITFQSTKVWKTPDGHVKMAGNLTMHGVTKELTLDLDGPTPAITNSGTLRRGVEATGQLTRQDFGLTADPGIVGDTVKVTIDVEIAQPIPGAVQGRGTTAASPTAGTDH